jgi:hypothetical protein
MNVDRLNVLLLAGIAAVLLGAFSRRISPGLVQWRTTFLIVGIVLLAASAIFEIPSFRGGWRDAVGR